MATVKKRNWCFVAYPESLPDNWKEILQETGLQCAISPLHDKDIDPDGNVKKAHYHVILCYSGPTSFNVVLKLTESLKQPNPQALEQVKGYYRYLTHKDNPEKYQYDEKEIECLNGFNILDYADLTKSEVIRLKIALQRLIIEQNIIEYAVLMDYLLHNEMINEYDIASSHTIFFNQYLRSRRHSVPEKTPEDKKKEDEFFAEMRKKTKALREGKFLSDADIEKNNLAISDGLVVDPETGEVISKDDI